MNNPRPIMADAIAPFAPPVQRTTPMRVSFATWQLSTLAGGSLEAECKGLNATSLDEAIKLATPPEMPVQLASGGFPAFVILETDDTAREGKARHTLHFYTVKVKRDWRAVGPHGDARKVAIPYAVHSGSLAMSEFDPRRPFQAGTDDPANGRQPGEARMIEARSVRSTREATAAPVCMIDADAINQGPGASLRSDPVAPNQGDDR